jgi:deoxyribodipyrimidine photo-lyase
MKKQNLLLWLRNDLRLEDNEALFKANEHAEQIIPLYIIDPVLFEQTELGFKRSGNFRMKFLLESLRNLKEQLQAIGGDLMVRVGKASEIIPALAKEYQASAVYGSKEVCAEEVSEEQRLEKQLFKAGIELRLFWQSTLFHQEDLPFGIVHLPGIFTEFRKDCEKLCSVRPLFPKPAAIQLPAGIVAGNIPSLSELGYSHTLVNAQSAFPFEGGETHAQARLQYYLWDSNLIKEYKETRNGLIGSDYSSKLSAWLTNGSLSPRYIYHQIKNYEQSRGANASTYWLIFELIWRDYFRFVAKKYGNRIFSIQGLNSQRIIWENDFDKFRKWLDAETGVPFIDANMRELRESGFMSNRGRQNVASFLCKDLHVNWTWGAAWFEHALADYDPCSNWCNWAYVAGVGNDPRENRYFNILSQAKRYDPKGDYIRQWLPQLAAIKDFSVNRPDRITPSLNYPSPMVNMGKWEN